MLDLLHHAINLLRDSVWGGIAVAVAILIPALGVLARAIYINRTSDLTRDELKLLKVFSDQAKGNPRAYLSVEITAYKAEVDEYEVKLRRLKDLGYLRDSSSRQATSAIALSGSPPAAFAEQKGNDKSFRRVPFTGSMFAPATSYRSVWTAHKKRVSIYKRQDHP